MMLCSICENGRIFDLKPKVFGLFNAVLFCQGASLAEAELCTTHNFISTKAKTKSTGKLH